MPWTKQGSGCDKTFYWDGVDKDGWLNFKTQGVLDAEIASRGKLGNVRDVIPEIDQSRNAPQLADGAKPLGYYIRRVNLGLTIKPQMNFFEVIKKVKTEIKGVQGGEKPAALKRSLQFMLDHCDLICNEVGEFTFGIDRDTGRAYLLDLAKSNGQSGGGDQAEKAKRGLKNMIAELG